MRYAIVPATVAATLFLVTVCPAETKMKVTGVHICCATCVKHIEDALSKVKGVRAEVDRKHRSIMITAKDDVAAFRSFKALMKAGFWGKIDNNAVRREFGHDFAIFHRDRVELTGAHNCCALCAKSITKAVKSVKGVKKVIIKPKANTFVVEGDNFRVPSVFIAMLMAGFYVRIVPAKE